MTWPDVTGPKKKRLAELLERDSQIFDSVQRGQFEHDWCPLVLREGRDKLELSVSCDALKIDGVRVNASAFTQQEIADELGALLLTPKLVDRIFRASDKHPRPQTMSISSSTIAMIQHSERVQAEAERLKVTIPPPLSNVGKDWVISKKLFSKGARAKNASVNYGWLGVGTDRSVTGLPIIQSEGTHHNIGSDDEAGHADYSQTLRFVHRFATLNGKPVDLADVYTGKEEGTHLVSHEGALPSARVPGVPDEPTRGKPAPPGFKPPTTLPASFVPPETDKLFLARTLAGLIITASIAVALRKL